VRKRSSSTSIFEQRSSRTFPESDFKKAISHEEQVKINRSILGFGKTHPNILFGNAPSCARAVAVACRGNTQPELPSTHPGGANHHLTTSGRRAAAARSGQTRRERAPA